MFSSEEFFRKMGAVGFLSIPDHFKLSTEEALELKELQANVTKKFGKRTATYVPSRGESAFFMLQSSGEWITKDDFFQFARLLLRDFTEDDLNNLYKRLNPIATGHIKKTDLFEIYVDESKGTKLHTIVEQMPSLLTIFSSLDANKDGTLTYDEFRDALKLLSVSENEEEMRDLFLKVCPENEQVLRFPDFANAVRMSSACRIVCQRVMASFLELQTVHHTLELCGSSIDPMALKILKYWFPPALSDCMALWFGKEEATDIFIRKEFGEAVLNARDGKLDSWISSPIGTVALVILLDQFPRNIFRNTAEAFSCDPMALAVVSRAMFYGYHKKVSKVENVFFCLVLTHSELLHNQILCLDLWEYVTTDLPDNDPLRKFDSIFKKHYDVILKFRRFPHRNDVLGRPSTKEEKVFLNDPTYRFDLPMKRDATFISVLAAK